MAGPNNTLSELLDELVRLGREAADLDNRLRTAGAALEESSGRDPSGQVRVVLTAAGRIRAAEVAPGWRSHINPGDLGTAVLAACREAGSRRTETWAAEVSRAKNKTNPGDGFAGPKESSSPATRVGGPDHDSIRGLWYLLQDATDRFDSLAAEATARSQTVTTGRDPAHHINATFTGGELSGLHAEERWSAHASGREIGTAITSAINDGYATIDGLAERSLTSQWPFPDLERFTSDPSALLTALGLPDPHTQHDQQR